MGHGGVRENSGRKSKAEELGLKEKLSPMEPLFLKALGKGLKEDNGVAMKLFADYFYGKPTETVNLKGQMDILWNELRNYEPDEKTDEGT